MDADLSTFHARMKEEIHLYWRTTLRKINYDEPEEIPAPQKLERSDSSDAQPK